MSIFRKTLQKLHDNLDFDAALKNNSSSSLVTPEKKKMVKEAIDKHVAALDKEFQDAGKLKTLLDEYKKKIKEIHSEYFYNNMGSFNVKNLDKKFEEIHALTWGLERELRQLNKDHKYLK